MYFSDFDGNWNLDNDSHYGEPQDGVDNGQEILMGRIQPQNEWEVRNWTRKVLQYEKNPGNGDFSYLTKAFYIQADQLQDRDRARQIAFSARWCLDTTIFEEEGGCGAGNDNIDGGNGNDNIYGDSGNNTLCGGAGDDTYMKVSISDFNTIIDTSGSNDKINLVESKSDVYLIFNVKSNGTFDSDYDKLGIVTFDSVDNTYRIIGESVAKAFSEGLKIK